MHPRIEREGLPQRGGGDDDNPSEPPAVLAEGAYSSTDLRDFGFAPAVAGTATTSYDANARTMAGTFRLGCSLTGTLAPHASGKNVFNASLRFGPAPCALPNQTASGIALNSRAPAGEPFIFARHDAARQFGTAATGIR